MDFSLSEFESMLSDSVEKFVVNEYDFESRQAYASSENGFSAEVWQSFCDLGWTAMPFSEEDGGLGGGPVETMLLMQQFGRGLIVEPYLANVILAGGVLRRLASDEQKAQWLAPIISGESHAALAFVEPQSGYTLSNVDTTATPDGDGWLINGHKGVVLNGGNANLLIVPARTAGDAVAEDGISLFAVASDSQGVQLQPYSTIDGQQAAEISFENVAAGTLLGQEGQGYATLESVIGEATLAVCAEAVGIMQILTDKTVEYSKNRVQFGVPIGSFQALQHRMVDMLTASEQSYSLLLWATMANAANSDEARRAINAIKYQINTAGKKVGQEAVQLHGGMGVAWEFDVGHYFKRLTAIGQMFGSADWHLDKLAK